VGPVPQAPRQVLLGAVGGVGEQQQGASMCTRGGPRGAASAGLTPAARRSRQIQPQRTRMMMRREMMEGMISQWMTPAKQRAHPGPRQQQVQVLQEGPLPHKVLLQGDVTRCQGDPTRRVAQVMQRRGSAGRSSLSPQGQQLSWALWVSTAPEPQHLWHQGQARLLQCPALTRSSSQSPSSRGHSSSSSLPTPASAVMC
jgi:hypothetical protein